ncbi:MAG TPA: AAA family ATPase [Lachnospiraceae bacterium]|jgi:hypothetical protein|nr:AAA family ATPase [Lachnospiraceae bacterium]
MEKVKAYQLYSEVKETPVDWLWYPYFAYGKVSILQGDPGDGKSLMIMNIISALSSGRTLPGESGSREKEYVIYQCSEDGIGDTIKPRLMRAGADCSHVAFITEDSSVLTLDDERIRETIEETGARLVVIDPVQAYLGDADLSNANSIRRIMRRLSLWAERYHCAIILVGHLNKKESSKDLYRSLGSIDIMAAARSVLQIERDEENPNVRIVRQVKNSLAPSGKDIYFSIDSFWGFRWMADKGDVPSEFDASETSEPENEEPELPKTKQEIAAQLIQTQLAAGPVLASKMKEICTHADISQRTTAIAKQLIGVHAFRKDGKWYWTLNKPRVETGGIEDAR